MPSYPSLPDSPPPCTGAAADQQRAYEVMEFNFTSDFASGTRDLCTHGNLTRQSLPRLASCLDPAVRSWNSQKSLWSTLMGG